MLVGAFALVGVGAFGAALSPPALLASAVGVPFALVSYGSWRWAMGRMA